MGYWEFNEANPSDVRVEVTQRDQFNNDDVALAEALVREAIQNSSDAPSGAGPVKVRFAVRTVTGSAAKQFAAQLNPLRPHLKNCGIDLSILDSEVIRTLAIEDFNTTGLTGSLVEVDGGNFDRFWRAVGDSGKKGKAGGRWGLGKLVYSSASAVKLFYGVTVSADHPSPLLMGQVVLKNHRLGSLFYRAHGFYFDDRSPPLNLQQPIQDTHAIQEMRDFANLTRTTQKGLSIVIPYLVEGIDEVSLISGVVNNYYFPILAGRLVVEVGELSITKETFLNIAATYSKQQIPFGFVKEISDGIGKTPDVVITQPIGNRELDASFFSADQIELLKRQFAEGQLVRARIPVVLKPLKPKAGTDALSFVDLYLRALPEGSRTFALVARGAITLPAERKYFGAAAAYGALIANDDGVAGFLGDAENPAHTAWNSNAENLKRSWRSPQPTLSAIRHSLRHFYGLVAEQAEAEDPKALVDFFSILEKALARKGKKKSPKINIEIKPTAKAIRIRPRKAGFDIVAGPAALSWTYPRNIRVRVAYDMIGGNPFKRHSPFDFDLSANSKVEIDANGATYSATKPNVLMITVLNKDFHVSVSGFDEHRDIVVDARAV